MCYCRKRVIYGSDVKEKNGCKSKCPGNKDELCGSIQKWKTGKPYGSPQITTHVTVSEISNFTNQFTMVRILENEKVVNIKIKDKFMTP